MKTLVLVAGQSKRFWPLSEKALFPMCGQPLLQHIVERLREGGCTDLVFVGGAHNLEEVRALLPDATTVEQEDLSLGMRGALLSALPMLGDEDVLIVSSNDLVEPRAYHAVREAGLQDGVAGAMLAQTVSSYFPGGYLSVQDGRVTGIVEKPGRGNEPSNLVTIVCHYHRNASTLLSALAGTHSANDDGYEQALAALFAAHRFVAVPYDGFWQAVKFPWHTIRALPHLLARVARSIDPTAHVHPTAVLEGEVVLEEGVRVLPHATIVGPVTIGRGSVVGNNALVRGSSIGEQCVIGYNTEVKGSILCDHVWTHSTYIGDSVIGRNVSFGAGSVTGNLRLDEGEVLSLIDGEKLGTGLAKLGAIVGEGCRIGIHVSVHPGVKIGKESFVDSATLVSRDVPDRSFAKMQDGSLHVRPNSASPATPEGRSAYKKAL